jgi:hypothetical protein
MAVVAKKDDNDVSTLIGALNTDGKSITLIKANPTTHLLSVSDGTTGSDFGPVNALRDENHIPVLLAVSSVDGVTPVVVYCDSSGNLLTKST